MSVLNATIESAQARGGGGGGGGGWGGGGWGGGGGGGGVVGRGWGGAGGWVGGGGGGEGGGAGGERADARPRQALSRIDRRYEVAERAGWRGETQPTPRPCALDGAKGA